MCHGLDTTMDVDQNPSVNGDEEGNDTMSAQRGMRKAVYMFGGVIVGPGAKEVARTIDDICHSDGSTSCEESDIAVLRLVDASHLHVNKDELGDDEVGTGPSQEKKRARLAHDKLGLKTEMGQVRGEEHRNVGFKRKSAIINPFPRSRHKGRGDATPRAPGGWAAAHAIASGQGCTSFVSECDLPTSKGDFRLRAYRYNGPDKFHEPVVMVAGDVKGREHIPIRVHDQCQTSEVLGSRRCDCREQLDLSLQYIQEHGGAVIYLQQEGRGIGLANKVAAYALQDGGLDTVDANRRLGFKDDQRSYECVDFILRDMDIKSVRLMTNNPYKVNWLKATGVKITGRIPIVVPSNKHNQRYLKSKADRMSHLINNL
ncbi:unnamed protein product [Choristocarpus tenellus]